MEEHKPADLPAMPGNGTMQEGTTPPEKPEGDTTQEGTTPPELPENGATPPEKPEGEAPADGEQPDGSAGLLKDLLDAGIITEAEYETLSARMTAASADTTTETTTNE